MGGIIYLVTCSVNGKHYVGQTVRTLEERWAQHLREAGPQRFETPLHRAIRRYGIGAFKLEVLEHIQRRTDLNLKEAEYAYLYDALVPNGYGLRAGNGRGSAFSSLTIFRMRTGAVLRAQTLEWKQRQRASQIDAQSRPDVRAVKSLATTRLWRDERYRNKQTSARTSDAYRAANSGLRRLEWSDPELRARHMTGIQSAASKMSTSSRLRWSDPAYQARLSAAQRAAWRKRRGKKRLSLGPLDDGPSRPS